MGGTTHSVPEQVTVRGRFFWYRILGGIKMAEFTTNLVHGPAVNDNQTGAVATPVYKATTYTFSAIGAPVKYDYSRSGNPTRLAVEKQLATLEGGGQAFTFASGMAAIHAALAIFKAGDHIIVGNQIYGGTFRLFHQFFERWGLTFTSVDLRDPDQLAQAVQKNTKAIYFEPVTNPLLEVISVRQVTDFAKAHHLLTLVDNTFLSPALMQPLKLGADIVIHSATKYLAGHSELSAGVVVANDPKLADQVYFIQNALGAILSPEGANELTRGIKTLQLRINQQQANACQLVRFLKSRTEVDRVYYPGLPDQPGYAILQTEAKGAGAVVAFELTASQDPVKFVNHLRLFTRAVSLGAVESLVELPSKMSHAELSPTEQLAAGIKPGLIRLAVGIEDAKDLITDLSQAFTKANKKGA